MRLSRFKNTIISILCLAPMALALLLGGCGGSMRLTYSTGPQLAWWWADGYMDFSREQTGAVKQSLTDFFEWHRSTQLTGYLPVLAAVRAQVADPATPAQVCQLRTQVREKLEPTLNHALDLAADIVPNLGETQFKYLEKRYAKIRAELRRDYLQPDPVERQSEAVKRVQDRAERLYGRLGDVQLHVLRDGVAASPFDAELWLDERQRRQHETLQTLRHLVEEKADRDQRVAALRRLVAHMEHSPNAVYRAYQVKLDSYNCVLAAQLHNATTPVQRQRARDTLKNWEDDLRALSATKFE